MICFGFASQRVVIHVENLAPDFESVRSVNQNQFRVSGIVLFLSTVFTLDYLMTVHELTRLVVVENFAPDFQPK